MVNAPRQLAFTWSGLLSPTALPTGSDVSRASIFSAFPVCVRAIRLVTVGANTGVSSVLSPSTFSQGQLEAPMAPVVLQGGCSFPSGPLCQDALQKACPSWCSLLLSQAASWTIASFRVCLLFKVLGQALLTEGNPQQCPIGMFLWAHAGGCGSSVRPTGWGTCMLN